MNHKPRNSTSKSLPKRNFSNMHTKTRMQMSTATLTFCKNPNWKQFKWLLSDELEGKKKKEYVHKIKILIIERKEILIHATTWMNLKNIILSKRIEIQNNTIICFFLYEMFRKGKFIETAEE